MAKEKSTSKKEFSFLELDKQLSKIEGFEAGSILEENEFSEVTEWIGTGNYVLNAQLSGSLFGGVANNRSMGIAGDPQTGKSFLCMNIVRESQKQGYSVIYCDTEGAIDKSMAKKFGIDTTTVRYQPIKSISDFKIFVANLVDQIKKARKEGADPKILLVLDSLGMLTTMKESADALKGKTAMDMGIRSKEMRGLFREASGGDGPIFSMSNVIMLSKAQLKDSNDKKTGIIVTSTPKKTRFTRPYPTKFHISFINGMNPYVGLEEFVSWDICGIERGKLEVDKKTGELEFTPSASSTKWAIAHLGKSIFSSQLFTPEVFTEEVLRKIDEKAIKPHFLLPDLFDLKELDSIIDSEEETEEDGEE